MDLKRCYRIILNESEKKKDDDSDWFITDFY